MDFEWDRRFGDDTIAEAGTYDVKVFASDRLGNIAEKSASIRVVIEILPPGPTSTRVANTAPPVISFTATPVYVATHTSTPRATQITTIFGAIAPTAQATVTPATTPTPRTTPTQSNTVNWLQSIFGPETTASNITEVGSPEEPEPASTDNSVLWGTAATAAIASVTMYLEEKKRKREEEKARLQALEEDREERREKMKERKTEKMEAQRTQEAAWEAARQEAWAPIHIDAKIARLENEEGLNSVKATPATNPAPSKPSGQDKRTERKEEIIQEEINSYTAKPQEWKTDYETYVAQQALLAKEKEKQKEKEASASKPKEKSWWNKAVDWVDDHQVEIALGIGVVVGAAVVVLSAGTALPLVAAGALVVSAAVGAGGAAAAMTMGLNHYYGRPWNENLLRNAAYAGITAAAVSAVGLLFKAAATGVSAYCARHQSTCARVEPVFNAIDKVEETSLRAKLAYQIWTHNEAGAAETAFELHSEYVDGGMPGNAVAKELGEQVNHLSKNAAPLIKKYGNEVIPLLVKHGDEGLQFIQKFGLDGIALLQKHGNDATDLIHLDPDVLEYVMQQGDDAVAALSRWSAEELREHGLELALRAKKDAEVLASIKKLTSSGKVDPNNLTAEQQALIDAIAANSTQYAENGQVVLGKWVDISNGFVQTAQETGSVHYNPHPDMWTMLGRLGNAKQEEVAWLVNKQVVQNGIAKGLPFEYTLNGVPSRSIKKEQAAIQAIFSGKSNTEIMDILQQEYLPVRMKELQELQKAGYELTFDNVNKSYILVKK